MRQTFKVVRSPVVRVTSGENFTPGVMYLDNVRFCYTCEDEDRFLENVPDSIKEAKVYGKTAIPRGLYRLTVDFSPHFGKQLPLVNDVPGFSGIRIHGGNTAEDSLGCILAVKVRTANGIAQCADTVKRIIDAVESAEELGIESWLKVE